MTKTTPWDPPLGVAAVERERAKEPKVQMAVGINIDPEKRKKAMQALYKRSAEWEGLHVMPATMLQNAIHEFIGALLPDWCEWHWSLMLHTRPEDDHEHACTEIIGTLTGDEVLDAMRRWIANEEAKEVKSKHD